MMNPSVPIIAICLMMTGCMIIPDSVTVQRKFEPSATTVSHQQLTALVPGSQVEIKYQTETINIRHVGTVLKAGVQGVALMNCQYFAQSHNADRSILGQLPITRRWFKVSGFGRQQIPVEWVSITKMTELNVISPPPADYAAPQLEINTDDRTVFERVGVDFDFDFVQQPASGDDLKPSVHAKSSR